MKKKAKIYNSGCSQRPQNVCIQSLESVLRIMTANVSGVRGGYADVTAR